MEITIIVWILFAIFSAALASSKNRSTVGWFFIGLLFGPFGLLVAFFSKIENQNMPSTIPISQDKQSDKYDDEWNTLIKYDGDAKAAVQKLEQYGSTAIDELKKAYKVINDKAQLDTIANQIITDIEKRKDTDYLMQKFNITFENNKYIYDGYQYSKLEDAIKYAKSKS